MSPFSILERKSGATERNILEWKVARFGRGDNFDAPLQRTIDIGIEQGVDRVHGLDRKALDAPSLLGEETTVERDPRRRTDDERCCMQARLRKLLRLLEIVAQSVT